MGRSWRKRPEIGLAAHVGPVESLFIPVARPGVGRQIHAGGIQVLRPPSATASVNLLRSS